MGARPIYCFDPADVFAEGFFNDGWMPVAFVAAVEVIGEDGSTVTVFYSDAETPMPMTRGLAELLRDRLATGDVIREVQDAAQA